MTTASSSGSSPRVRGTVPRAGAGKGQFRFIPARAGNSGNRRPDRRTAPVHPRACGEQRGEVDQRVHFVGSSPRVRGTVLRAVARLAMRCGSSPRVRGTVRFEMVFWS